ncbi:murein biosynthesis integral membrane protein MurJ, partial [Erythrobacter donghaensis]
IIALPAAIGGGAYQINTLVQLYFLNQIGEGAVSYMNYADRLNQLPLGIIGIALSTAILPTLSKFVGSDNREGASRVQSDAIELAMLLTLPATVALAVCAEAFVTMIFAGGRFGLADAAATGAVLAALVMGLPAYVLVKVLVPNFYARADTKTPVIAAFISLGVFVAASILLLASMGVVGVALASVIGAWINLVFLLLVLAWRGHYRIPPVLVLRIGRQAIAAAAMGAALFYAQGMLTDWFAAGLFARLGALIALVAAAGIVYFGLAFAIGALDRQRIAALTKRAN